jgi:hypothetical protein
VIASVEIIIFTHIDVSDHLIKSVWSAGMAENTNKPIEIVQDDQDLIILGLAFTSSSGARGAGSQQTARRNLLTGYSFYRLAGSIEDKQWVLNLMETRSAEGRAWTDERRLVADLAAVSEEWYRPIVIHFGPREEFFGPLRERALAFDVPLRWIWRVHDRDNWPIFDSRSLDLRHRMFGQVGLDNYSLERASELIKVPLEDYLRRCAGGRVEAELRATATFALFIRLCRYEEVTDCEASRLLRSQFVELADNERPSRPHLAQLIRDFE